MRTFVIILVVLAVLSGSIVTVTALTPPSPSSTGSATNASLQERCMNAIRESQDDGQSLSPEIRERCMNAIRESQDDGQSLSPEIRRRLNAIQESQGDHQGLSLAIQAFKGTLNRLSGLRLKNLTITIEQTQLSGTLATAENKLILLRVGDQLVSIIATNSWLVGEDVKTFFRLFVDDDLNKGDSLSIDTLMVTTTSTNGPDLVVYIATKITDSTTNEIIEAILPVNTG